MPSLCLLRGLERGVGRRGSRRVPSVEENTKNRRLLENSLLYSGEFCETSSPAHHFGNGKSEARALFMLLLSSHDL